MGLARRGTLLCYPCVPPTEQVLPHSLPTWKIISEKPSRILPPKTIPPPRGNGGWMILAKADRKSDGRLKE
jgi:hypothetical protein